MLYQFLDIQFFLSHAGVLSKPKVLSELKRAGEEWADDTQHALTDGKVHIPRTLHCLPDQNNESKNHPRLHIHHPVGTGPFLKGQLFNTHTH